MFKRATGSLGYTPREALDSNVNDLQIAFEGRQDFLVQIFGKKDGEQPKPKPMSADVFRDMAERHNAKFRQK